MNSLENSLDFIERRFGCTEHLQCVFRFWNVVVTVRLFPLRFRVPNYVKWPI